jgi:hypothetical protein
MIHIDIFIPFYMYVTDVHRYNLTKINFKHLSLVKEKLQGRAKLTFTLLGSEKERSKQLALEYFPASDYYEFDQNDERFAGKDFWTMFDVKMKTGIALSRSKDPDIVLWMGSNDYVPFRFFDDIVNYYNTHEGATKEHMYGIDNYHEGENAVFFCIFDGDTNKIDIHNNAFWWTGLSPHPRDKYKYCGGAIGFNKAVYTNHPDIIDKWSFDEGEDELMMRSKKSIQKFTSKHNYYVNIKMKSGNELNSFSRLQGYFKHHIVKFTEFKPEFAQFIMDDMEYLIQLMADIETY